MVRSSSGSFSSVSMSGSERHSHSGTPSSGTFLRATGTPALRKYFWARMSEATCEKWAGTSTSSMRKTSEPSGLRISLVMRVNATFS